MVSKALQKLEFRTVRMYANRPCAVEILSKRLRGQIRINAQENRKGTVSSPMSLQPRWVREELCKNIDQIFRRIIVGGLLPVFWIIIDGTKSFRPLC